MLSKILQTFSPSYWPTLPSKAAVYAMSAILAFIAFAMTKWNWVPLLSGTTLLIHEAGHPIIGMIFGDRMMVYGGTIFQLLFPIIFAWHFAKQFQPMGYCFSWIWEASSFRNVAIYAADARAQELPLVGNGDRIHDWNFILSNWNLLSSDQFIGGVFTFAAWTILLVIFLLLIRFYLSTEAT